jgi:hypothetical protein
MRYKALFAEEAQCTRRVHEHSEANSNAVARRLALF